MKIQVRYQINNYVHKYSVFKNKVTFQRNLSAMRVTNRSNHFITTVRSVKMYDHVQ